MADSLLQSADLPSRFWVALRELGRDTIDAAQALWPLEAVIIALEEAEL